MGSENGPDSPFLRDIPGEKMDFPGNFPLYLVLMKLIYYKYRMDIPQVSQDPKGPDGIFLEISLGKLC